MKKMILLITLLFMTALADEAELCVRKSGKIQYCSHGGYVCKLGTAIGAQQNNIYFFLGKTKECDTNNFFKSDSLKTNLDVVNAATGSVIGKQPSTMTKFFIANDGQYANALSVTVAGSYALSAYRNSDSVYVYYAMADSNENGGIKVLNLDFFSKPSN